METHLLQDLAVVMAAAGLMTLLCHKLRQPVVIGYLIAGLLIGPYTPPFSFISSIKSIHTMAELGLVFLLFSLGLEFNLPKIQKVGMSAGLAAVLEVVGMLTIGYFLGQAFGWSKTDSIFLGSILSISSTTIIVKVFMDFKMMNEKFVQVVFGILVLEDVVAIAILSILSGLGQQGGPDAISVAISFLKIGLFVTLFLVIGLLIVPRFVHWVALIKSKEVLGVVTLGLCLGGAMLAHAADLSIALGAFLTGAVLAATKEIHDIEEWIHPVRDMFSAIFFVSAGMLIQPALLWEYKGPIAIITVVTLVGKVLSGGGGAFLAGYDMKTSARVGMSLAQIGEFSFVIASLGLSLKVTSDFLYPLAVMVSSLTTLATPYLIRNSDRIVEGALAITPVPLRQRLDSYHVWLEKTKSNSSGTPIFSKYLVRLGVYFAIFTAVLIFLNALSTVIKNRVFFGNPLWDTVFFTTGWVAATALCFPLFTAISKYANHIILLLVTRSKRLLHYINVHAFYNTLDAATKLFLGLAFVGAASRYVAESRALIIAAILLFFINRAFRKKIGRGKEWLERVLDQITGLATSEPTRQAVMKSGDGKLLLVDITDQITLAANSPVVGLSVRETKLREKTGSSIVAIYRDGKHIANPGPDAILLADDVLVLLGIEEELQKSRQMLNLPAET